MLNTSSDLDTGLIKKIVYLEEGKPRLKYVLLLANEFMRLFKGSFGIFKQIAEEKGREQRVPY